MKKIIAAGLIVGMILGMSISAFAAEKDDTSIEMMRVATPGSFVTYGSYEQDNVTKNGKEPIEWKVLENNGSSLLLMSRYVLDGKSFSDAYLNGNTWEPIPVTWETCSLRAWLNSEFLTTAFTENEQLRIMTVKNSNTPSDFNPNETWYSIDANGNRIPLPITNFGNDTFDRVFVLSIDEVKKYFPMDITRKTDYGTLPASSQLLIQATPYAQKHGAEIWSEKIAQACISNGGGYKYFANDIIGYATKIVLRTLDGHGGNKSVLNIGADGTPGGTRTVTYDFGNCPAIRLNLQ